jgi:hypothetical protein
VGETVGEEPLVVERLEPNREARPNRLERGDDRLRVGAPPEAASSAWRESQVISMSSREVATVTRSRRLVPPAG